MPVTFVTETSHPSHRAAFGAVGFVLCAAAVAALVLPSLPLQASNRAVVAAIVLTLPANWVTTYLLEAQFRLSKRPSLAVLGAAFWYSAMISIAYLAALPTTGDEPSLYNASDQAATWLWVLWRFGFLLFMTAFVLLDRFTGPAKISDRTAIAVRVGVGGGIPVVVALLALGIVIFSDRLPAVVSEGRFNPAFSIVVGYPALVFHVVLLAAFVALTRLKSLTDLALAFALLTWLLGDVLTIVAAARFTFGWYLGLVDYVAACLAMPIAFLIRLHALYVEVEQMNENLSALALLDGLTGLANRRLFDQRLASEWSAATRRHEGIALIMADLDFFKLYNDRYGHPAGDECLRRVAAALRGCVKRALDLPARYGGEEFAVILPATDLAGATTVAERIRDAVGSLAIEHEDGPGGIVTISAGVATILPAPGQTPTMLTAAADQALYRAKQGGRNRVEAAPDLAVLAAPQRL